MNPRIGITVSQSRDPSLGRLWNGTALAYAKGVARAGGLPVMLPLLPGTEAAQLEHLDGLLFSGGVDVDPELFGAEHEAGLGEIDALRDTFEFALYTLAREAKLPILGICRGFQLINVAEGGTLHQHLPTATTPNHDPYWADHAQRAHPPALGHRVRLAPHTRLAHGSGSETLKVNSHHHQGLRDLAPSLEASAWAPDGLIEAFEGPGLLAVQWHPELIFEEHPVHLVPFQLLIEMAKTHANSSTKTATGR